MSSLQKAIQKALQKDSKFSTPTKMELLQSFEIPYSKYNVRVDKIGKQERIIDNIEFQSLAEASYYNRNLKLRVKAGEIFDLDFQAVFVLQEEFIDWGGNKQKPITYLADFTYWDKLGKFWVVDVKGEKTETYKLKKKLFLFKYPTHCFLEVTT